MTHPHGARLARRCRGNCRCEPHETLGGMLHAHLHTQIHNGHKAQLVLYEYDFENDPAEDTTRLNLAGQRKLHRLSPIIKSTGAPVIIEQTPRWPEVGEARRLNVVNFLSIDLQCPVSDSQVVVKAVPTRGIRGVEAVEIDRNQLQTTRSQGITFSGFESSRRTLGTSNRQGTGTR